MRQQARRAAIRKIAAFSFLLPVTYQLCCVSLVRNWQGNELYRSMDFSFARSLLWRAAGQLA
jgi:hypothetical protein